MTKFRDKRRGYTDLELDHHHTLHGRSHHEHRTVNINLENHIN